MFAGQLCDIVEQTANDNRIQVINRLGPSIADVILSRCEGPCARFCVWPRLWALKRLPSRLSPRVKGKS